MVSLPERLLGYRQHQGNVVGWTSDSPHGASRQSRQAVADDIARIVGMLVPFCNALGKATEFEGSLAPAVAEARAKNLALIDRLERRLALYSAPSLRRRFEALRALLRNNDYAQNHDWGFGRRALMQDLTVGLFGRTAAKA